MSIPDELAVAIQQYSDEFDTLARERHEIGAEKYGPGKFLTTDTMREALYELVDLANYARYTFIRVRLLQEQITSENQPDFTKELS